MSKSNALAVVGGKTEIAEQDVAALANDVQPLWPKDLNKQQAFALARVALAYGLDPMRGELVPYQGKPYVTLDGYIRIADKNPQYNGFTHRPATQEEREGLGAAKGETVWVANVYRKDRDYPVTMYGRAGGSNERNPLVSGKNRANQVFIEPSDQALIRALRRAMRASLAIPLPGEDEDRVTPAQLRHIHAIDRERGVDTDQRHHELREVFDVESSDKLTKEQASAYIDKRKVDTNTGEILPTITTEQMERVGQLCDEMAVNTEEIQELASAQFGVSVSALTEDQAGQVINALEGIQAERQAPDPESEPEPEPESEGVVPGPDELDITNWNQFWQWAKPRGYASRDELAEILGVNPADYEPGKLVGMILDYEADE